MILTNSNLKYHRKILAKSKVNLSNEEILNSVCYAFGVMPEDVFNPPIGSKHSTTTIRGIFLYVVLKLYKTKLTGMFDYKESDVDGRIKTITNLVEVDKEFRYIVNEIIKLLIKRENY